MFKNLFKVSLIVASLVMFSCSAEEELPVVVEETSSEATENLMY